MLDRRAQPNVARLAKCRLRIDQELEKEFDRANALLAAGNIDGERRLLDKIDARYGGLAAPRSVDLAARILGTDRGGDP
jgi:hypothetical protein